MFCYKCYRELIFLLIFPKIWCVARFRPNWRCVFCQGGLVVGHGGVFEFLQNLLGDRRFVFPPYRGSTLIFYFK